MNKKKLPQKTKLFISKFGPLADPLIIVGILIFFTIPILTVINLTPKVMPQDESQVLGTTDSQNVQFSFNEITTNNITINKVIQNSEESYTTFISYEKSEAGEYSNQLAEVNNQSSDQKKIQITPVFNGTPNNCKISIEVNDVRKIILGDNGEIYPISIYLSPHESITINLVIAPQSNINYTNQFGLDISVE